MPRRSLAQRNAAPAPTPLAAQLSSTSHRAQSLDKDGAALLELRKLLLLRDQVNRAIDAGMAQARGEGASWAEIGGALKTSPQAAQQRVLKLS